MIRIRADALCKDFLIYPRRFGRVRALLRGSQPTLVRALDRVTFQVKAGEALGVIGENGAGKTTLLRVLAGITPPTGGSFEVEGQEATLLDLSAGFRQDFSARDNVLLAGAIRGFTRPEVLDRMDQILDFSGLESFADLPLRTYSDGMRVRLGFSVATMLPADVLFVDEVLAVGDQRFQRKCIEQAKAFLDAGGSLVLVSHSLHMVANLCTAALWIDHGRIAASGPAREVTDRYIDTLREREPEDGEARTAASVTVNATSVDAKEKSAATMGSGEARIVSVDLLDSEGHTPERFRTGEPMRVRVGFRAEEPIQDPGFGVALFRNDGVYIYGANTHFERFAGARGTFEGDHGFTITYPTLPLLPGNYLLSVAIYDREHVFPYDLHDKLYRFQVHSDREDHGIVAIEHGWEVE